MAKYEIEIWDKEGRPIADIRPICHNFSWTKTLNGSESVGFTIDLGRFEELLKSVGYDADPFVFMEVGRHDIRVKRNGQYIVGANIYRFTYTTADPSITLRVDCVGYLNYYKTRYITAQYDYTPQEDILWDVIDQCNQRTGGDYGVRRGTHVGESVSRDRKYERKEVASLITQMSNVINGCDFEFTPDKKFNTWATKGTYRPSIRLTYPGNIQSFNFSRTIDGVSNYIYGIGSGYGDEAIMSEAEDGDSEEYVYRREKVAMWNSVSVQSTLDEHTQSALAAAKDIIELPNITIRDGVVDLNELQTGDTIIVELGKFASMAHINGNYRVKTIECDVDENDAESVTLGFDGLDIDKIIQEQNEES